MAFVVWVVHLLLLVLVLMERLLTFPLTISKVGISSTEVLDQALLPLCLTCWSCAGLLLVLPSAFVVHVGAHPVRWGNNHALMTSPCPQHIHPSHSQKKRDVGVWLQVRSADLDSDD